jgi:hypothetical protein
MHHLSTLGMPGLVGQVTFVVVDEDLSAAIRARSSHSQGHLLRVLQLAVVWVVQPVWRAQTCMVAFVVEDEDLGAAIPRSSYKWGYLLRVLQSAVVWVVQSACMTQCMMRDWQGML